jgi:hypothetical protein
MISLKTTVLSSKQRGSSPSNTKRFWRLRAAGLCPPVTRFDICLRFSSTIEFHATDYLGALMR